jgi:ABC-2 type transport system permease protein
VSRGSANLLAERDGGTLARLMVTPTSMAQIMGGKVLGVFLTAVVQVALLIAASGVLFGLHWGNLAGAAALVLAVAAGATGWGMTIAAFARTPAMVGSLGSAAMLMFAVLGGSFGDNFPLPPFLQVVAKATPNAWGIQGFARLASGGSVGDVLPNVVALFGMAALTFAIAVLLFRRNGFVK